MVDQPVPLTRDGAGGKFAAGDDPDQLYHEVIRHLGNIVLCVQHLEPSLHRGFEALRQVIELSSDSPVDAASHAVKSIENLTPLRHY